MTMSSTLVLGMHLEAFLMALSGVLYLVCALFLWRPYRKEKNELIGALFAFLMYQAVSMFFMGLQMQTMNMDYSLIASFAVFVGSAYMLKFPFSSFSRTVRQAIFSVSIVAAIALFVWFTLTPERQMALMHFTLWYDLIVNGLVVGGSILIFGFAARERALKIKSLGGGSGVVSCCVAANTAMLSGALITSSVFAFLAPALILGTLFTGRRK